MKHKLFAIGIVMMLVMSGLVVGATFGGTTSGSSGNGAGSTEDCIFLPGNVCIHPGLEDSVMNNGVDVDDSDHGTKCADGGYTACWYVDDRTKKVMWDEDGLSGDQKGKVATSSNDIMSESLKTEDGAVVFTPETGFVRTAKRDKVTYYYTPDGIVIGSNGNVYVQSSTDDAQNPDGHKNQKIGSGVDFGNIKSIDYIGDMPYIVTGEGDGATHYFMQSESSKTDVTLSQREYDAVGETIQGAGGFSDYYESKDGIKSFTFGEPEDGRTRTSVGESDGVLSIYHASSEAGKVEFKQTSGEYQFTDGSTITFDEEFEAILDSGGSRVKGTLKYASKLKEYTIVNDDGDVLARVSNKAEDGTTTEYVNDGVTYKKTIDDGEGNRRAENYNDGQITSDYGTTSDGLQYETEYELKGTTGGFGDQLKSGTRYVYDGDGNLIGFNYDDAAANGMGNLEYVQYYIKIDNEGNVQFSSNEGTNWGDTLSTCTGSCLEALESAAQKKQHEENIISFAEGYDEVANIFSLSNDLYSINSLIFSQIDGYNELVNKIDSWFASSILGNPEKALTSLICDHMFFDSPQDMASDGIAVIENSYGNKQAIAMINAEVTESSALLCSLEFDEDDEGEYSCPEGLECNENDGFCYNENDERANGYFYKVTWGMSAPADEALTPEVMEGNLAVEYNVVLDKDDNDYYNFYESDSSEDCPLKLSNGESDGAVITWWSDQDYTGHEVCILWERCGTRIYTSGGDAMRTDFWKSQNPGTLITGNLVEMSDICNTIVKAKTGIVQLTNPDGYSLSTKSSNSDDDVDSNDDDIEVNYP
ncbi:hypothetical protein HOA65_02220 [archaeon]|nr:hypothetical protein [archaeon]